MSMMRSLVGLWKNREETSEKEKDPALKTRYYKERKDKLIDLILDLIPKKLPRWKVIHTDRERGEILVEKQGLLRKSDIVITVFRINPIRSAIDVMSAKRGSFGDLGDTYRDILLFFRVLHTAIKPEEKP
ncbi:conserved hypothetical protein [[Clostridium] ultunense Esp]|uniref:hypothetical protein n=1 Tax=Thermicanus aegyptius TaxID=94009 RepID=UPI0002B6F306|nr:hypothetical protein [Thermicanus aegyptius]CCQ97810.1 conserved hypothetical protein [[Clostridium] ultunense Esp]